MDLPPGLQDPSPLKPALKKNKQTKLGASDVFNTKDQPQKGVKGKPPDALGRTRREQPLREEEATPP